MCASNIALNSEVHLCAVKELPEDLADGNKRSAVKISDTSECTDNIFLSVTLDKLYYVHYVVVSGGSKTSNIFIHNHLNLIPLLYSRENVTDLKNEELVFYLILLPQNPSAADFASKLSFSFSLFT